MLDRYAKLFFIFSIGWWACFVFYPLWYVPNPSSFRPYLLVVILFLWVVCTYLFRFLVRSTQVLSQEDDPLPADRSFFLTLFSVATLLHVPFLNQPILAGLDTIDHAAIPAVVAERFVKALSSFTGFPIRPIFAFISVFFIVALFYSPFRKRVQDRFQDISTWMMHHWKRMTLFLICISGLYGAVILSTAIPERFGDLSPIFRYPPVSKLNLIPLYIVFGLHEWIGRLVQIAFTFGGAFYLYHLTRMFGTKAAAQTAAILFVFLPPLFHYGNTHMIEGGTMFFVAASFYHLIRYTEKKTAYNLIVGVLFTLFGGLYKHPLVSVVPAFTLMAVYDFVVPKKEDPRRFWLQPILACMLPSAAIILYLKLSAFNTDVPDKLSSLSLDRCLANLQAIPLGVTWPVAILFAVGFIYLAVSKYRRLFILLLCWIGVHYVLTCKTMVYQNVRQALPYYVGLIVAASIFIGDWVPKQRSVRAAVLYGIVPLYLIWACLFMDRHQNLEKVGRPMGDRSYVNFSNWQEAYIPYDQAMAYLKEHTEPGDIIYAPMTNEPSHFYLAKYDLFDRTYLRKIWLPRREQTMDNLYTYCIRQECDWLMVVRGKWLYSYADVDMLETLFTHPPDIFLPVTVFSYGETDVGLWKVVPRMEEREDGDSE